MKKFLKINTLADILRLLSLFMIIGFIILCCIKPSMFNDLSSIILSWTILFIFWTLLPKIEKND